MTSTSHIRRVLFVLVTAGVLGFALQRLLRPETFGDVDHYRAASVGDILDLEVIHQGKRVCGECHKDICEIHGKDIHLNVECEDCHGPGNTHVEFHRGQSTSVSKDQAAMPKEYTLEGCLFCHRKLSARPRTFAQIDPKEHYAFLHVTDPKTRCIACHSPHEPLFLLEKVSEARIHPVIFECDHCHDTSPEGDYREVAGHPVVFICRDCHPSVVRDFAKREHSFLRCTACHLFHRENETSGRIFKNGNRRFCLLCHERKPFKDKQRLPQIVYAEHLEAMAKVMRRNADSLKEDPTACLHCHFDYVHDSGLIRRLQELER